MDQSTRRPVLPSLLLAALAPAGAAQVLVVDDDGGPGVDFTSVQDAVAAAPDGALVLVREGVYPVALEIAGVGLTLVADSATPPRLEGTVEIRDTPPGRTVALRGFELVGTGVSLTVTDAAGVVRLEDLDLSRSFLVQPAIPTPPQSVRVFHSLQVRLARVVVGADVEPASPFGLPPGAPLPALDLQYSSVAAYHCTLRGAHGADALDHPLTLLPVAAQAGAPAVRLEQSTLRLDGCTLVGGDGGDAYFSTVGGCVAPADGGAGVLAVGLANAVVRVASDLAGGAAGSVQPNVFGVECPATADAGDPIEQVPGATLAVTTSAEPRTRLAVLPVAREDESVVLTADGPEVQVLLWGIALSPGPGTFPIFPSTNLLEVGPGPAVFLLGPTGPSPLTLAFPPLGDVLPAGAGLALYHQVVGYSFDGITLSTGEPAVSVLVDAGI